MTVNARIEEEIKVGRKSVQIYAQSGIVLGLHTSIVTNVSGGDGYVSSTTDKTVTFSLLAADGSEEPATIYNSDFFIRNGSRVSIVGANYKKRNRFCYGYNHDTKESRFMGKRVKFVYELRLVLGFPLWLHVIVVFGSLCTYGIPALVFYPIWLIQHVRAQIIWFRHLRPAIRRMLQKVQESTDRIVWAR